MTRSFAESLLFSSVAINAALLIFIAGVLRKVMNEMDVLAFQNFVKSLVIHSMKSPFMIVILNIPVAGAIPYFYCYGFGDLWITAGLGLWLAAGLISKIIKMPIYKAVSALQSSDAARLEAERKRLNAGNMLQATLNSVSAALMIVPLINK